MRYSIFLICFISTSLFAQNSVPQGTDKMRELKKFAVLSDTLNILTEKLKSRLTKFSAGDASTTASRYRQLLPIIDDNLKLTEAKATQAEISYVKKSRDMSMKESAEYTDAVQSLIDAYGNKEYTDMKNRLKTDLRLKVSFDSLMTIQAKRQKKAS